jgi:glycerol-3-phosphate O-acyltransferase
LVAAPATAKTLPMAQAYERVGRVTAALRSMASRGQLLISPELMDGDPMTVVHHALAHLGSYHRGPVLLRRGDRLISGNRPLLFYYQNRLEGYDLQPDAAG